MCGRKALLRNPRGHEWLEWNGTRRLELSGSAWDVLVQLRSNRW